MGTTAAMLHPPHVRVMEPWVSETEFCIHPLPFPGLAEPSKCAHTGGSTFKYNWGHCTGQLQPSLHHKPCRHFPYPLWQGRKGHLRRNKSNSSLHCTALIMESFCCSVHRAQNNALWEAQPCLAQVLSQLEWLKATSEPLHRARRAPASPPEYTMPCCSGPV